MSYIFPVVDQIIINVDATTMDERASAHPKEHEKFAQDVGDHDDEKETTSPISLISVYCPR